MVKSVKKAIDILFYLSNEPEKAATLGTIAKALELNQATCSRLLDTLCDSLMVEHVSRREGYRLGPSAYLLTRYGRYQESLIEVCTPVIRQVRQQLKATVFLTVVCDGIKYIIFNEEGNAPLDLRKSEIIRGNIETTASGLLMMAYMGKDALYRVCSRSKDAERFMTTLAGREASFAQIRKTGFVHLHDDENRRHTYAFRITDGTKTVASIGIIYPDAEDCPAMQKAVIQTGRSAAEEISRRLQFSS